MTILDIRPPEDAGALLDNVKAVTAGVDEAGVWRHRTRDGRVIRVEIVSHTLDFAGHRAEVVLANDVTDRLRAEARLKESEQKFRGIVQNAHAVIFILDREGIFLLSEGRGLARLGLKPGQVVGQSALDLYAPYPSVVEGIRKALAGELIQTTNDLSGNIYDTVYSPYFDEAGQVRGVIGIAIDITERRQAEEALRLTQFTVDKARDAIYWVDADARIFYVNEAACRALGYSREELLGLTVFDIAPGARDGWRDHWRDTTQRDAYLIEATHQTKDGRVFPVEISISVMRLPDRMFHCDFVRDISERRQAEQALRESEEKFRTLYENMTEGVALHELVHDEQGRVVDYRVLDVNPAFSRQCGIPAEMARGRTARDLYRTDAAPYLEEFAAVAGGGKPVIFDTYFATLDRHFRISAISPQAGRFATVFEDITERKQREAELQEKTDELMRFTYTVSHDLKSPLVTIRTFLGFLEQDLEKRDAERIAKDMGFMRNASEKMTRLLDELLELSRIGRMVNAPVDVSLQELAREALDLVAGRIASRGIRVRVDDAPVLVRGDRPRLVEVFQNLIDNAAKFMGDQTEPLIEIGVEDTRQGLAFFVRDNGEGIDSRHMHKLFGLFEKLNPDAEGTGIGLALVKRIVEVHGGRIWVESPGLGRGATFRFTLAGAKRAS
jgi:PAS domain S-box-containing protein